MNRAARRAAQANKRRIARLNAQIPVLDRILYLKKQKLELKREEFLRHMGDVVDDLATEANGFAEHHGSPLQAYIQKQLDVHVDDEFAESLVRVGWKGVTSKQEAFETLAREAVDRGTLKRDLAFTLSIIDGFALDLLSTVEPSQSDQDAATAIALAVEPKVRVKLTEHEELHKMRDRLAGYGWRGATAQTVEQRFARAIGQRVIELRRGPFPHDMIVERELSKLPKSEETKVFERFRQRVKYEEETIKVFRDTGLETVAATDSPSGVDGFAIDRALAAAGAAGAILAAPLIASAFDDQSMAKTRRAQAALAGALFGDTLRNLPPLPSSSSSPSEGALDPLAKGPILIDRDLMRFGQRVWQESYGQGFGENVAQAWVDNELDELAKTRQWDEESRRAMSMTLMFAGQWAVHAFQRVQTSHTFAAALMCTDPDKEALESIEPQWKAFMVLVPNGMLMAHLENGELYEFTRILVAVYTTKAQITMIAPGHRGGTVGQAGESATLAEALAGDIEQDTEEKRAFVMAKRLVAGLLLTMQKKSNYKQRDVPAKHGKPGKGDGEPAHRLVIVGHPITVDVRDDVHRYIKDGPVRRAQGHAPPGVRFVVRGHWREQAHGPRRSLRKTIWIKPFWKGVEGMPIVTSPKKLPGAKP